MAQKKKILIIDDHPLFREGLKSVIRCSNMYEIAGEASNARDGLQMAKKLNPDLVLMDLSLPDGSGIELTREVCNLLPNTRVMIVSMHSKIDFISDAFQAGATGYLVKDSVVQRLLKGLEIILKGEYFLDSSVSPQVVKRLMEAPEKEAKISNSAYRTLTAREQEVMRLLAEGISAKKIADKLFISPKTVENHRSKIMNKLSIHSIHELIRYAAKIGLIDVDLWKE